MILSYLCNNCLTELSEKKKKKVWENATKHVQKF